MLKYITADITTIESGVICQQVNCQGVMGAGLAKQLKLKYPRVFEDYKEYINETLEIAPRECLLGKVQVSKVSKDLKIANIFGQLNFSRLGIRSTNYCALFQGLYDLLINCKKAGLDLYIPKGIGCGLAKGNWEFVEQFLCDLSIMLKKDINIVELS